MKLTVRKPDQFDVCLAPRDKALRYMTEAIHTLVIDSPALLLLLRD